MNNSEFVFGEFSASDEDPNSEKSVAKKTFRAAGGFRVRHHVSVTLALNVYNMQFFFFRDIIRFLYELWTEMNSGCIQ